MSTVTPSRTLLLPLESAPPTRPAPRPARQLTLALRGPWPFVPFAAVAEPPAERYAAHDADAPTAGETPDAPAPHDATQLALALP